MKTKTHCKTPVGKLIERQALKCFNAKLGPVELERRMCAYLNGLKHRKVIDNFALIKRGLNVFILTGVCVLKDGKATSVIFEATFT
jgi:hypothetical protein